MAHAQIRKSQRKPLAFDCFAGCGGMTQGFREAGYRVVGAVEIDQDAVSVYKLNHPRVYVWNVDIKLLTARSILKELKLKRGDLDLLGGCPPCQGFSTLRTRNGHKQIRDERNDLIFEFERLVVGLLPKNVMLENVPGLLNDGRLRRFMSVLAQSGYIAKSDLLDVAHYGVPQRRRRVVVVASRVGVPQFAKQRLATSTVRSTISGLPRAGTSGDPLHDMPEQRSAEVRERIRLIPKDGGGRAALPNRLRLKCHNRSDGFKDVYGRMAWDELSPTITTGCFNPSKGRFLHPTANRAITLREAALLQSFPRHYRFSPSLGKVKLAEMIGNALPPKFISAHARALKRG